MKDTPLVSCVMPTYGRLNKGIDGSSLLNEAVESFLRQTYPNKELVIVNDAPNQTIVFDHPDVKVINCDKRFPSLGLKRNFTVEQSSGEYIVTWDDDDISLPNRLEETVRQFETTGVDYTSSKEYWYSERNSQYRYITCLDYGALPCASYRKSVFNKVQYRDTSVGEDAAFIADVRSAGLKINAFSLPKESLAYIYRWDYLATHISGFGSADGYGIIGQTELPTATINIKPEWLFPYHHIVADIARNQK